MNEIKFPGWDQESSGESIISNFDYVIDLEVAEKIQHAELWAPYTAWNFYGFVWFQDGLWHCLIKTYQVEREVISCKTLDELRDECSDEYGSD